jgi:UDP-N-acetylmuramoyl-tripeptide--D-alanyl-D-alanine ligase
LDLNRKKIAEVLKVLDYPAGVSTVQGVSVDTRTLKKGDLFFALKGESEDGSRFTEEALRKGASGVVLDPRGAETISSVLLRQCFIVSDPLCALQDVAAAYRNTFNIPVVAVTGSNGKTTTKEMIYAVLSHQFRVMKNPGNFNNHIGLALSICQWKRGIDIAVVEMGANHFGEITRLCEIARPTHGIVTNIGKGHLEFFGDLKGVVKAKSELLRYLVNRGEAFLNGDDVYLFPLRNLIKKTTTFGFSERCSMRARDLGMDDWGFPRMKVDGANIRLRIPGKHNLFNALAAAAVGRSFGIPWETIRDRLEIYRPKEKRMEILHIDGITVLNDTYNANPSSLWEAMVTLRSQKQIRRKIAVLGDMLELGDSEQAEHRQAGIWAAEMKLDGLYCYGTRMQWMIEEAKKGGMTHAFHYESKKALSEALIREVHSGDGILVKGSRGMKMEIIVEDLVRYFSKK